MKLRRFGQLLAASTVTAVALSGAPAFAQDNTVTISVSNITDIHGHLENGLPKDKTVKPGDEMGAALLQSLIKKVNEGQEYALTSSGDNVGGSAYISAISEDEYTMDVLNAMGLDATAVGNHEFDKGVDDLRDRIQPHSEFPILGANVLQNGKPILDASIVQEIGGVKVGFVGTVTQNTEFKVAPAMIPGVTFTDPVEATNKEAKHLKESGEADVVIALFHEDAQQFADGFSTDVDALFGGDTHVKTQGEVAREGALPLQWAQGHEYGKLLNDLDITFDTKAKKVTDIKMKQYDATDAASLSEDAEIAAIVDEAAAKAEELGADVVGTMPEALFRGSDEGKGSGSNRGVESTLNNFIAQAQRKSVAKAVGKEIDLGVMNAGGVRADLPAGEVTYKDVFTVQPFGNAVAYCKVSGADLIKALENQWQEGASRPRLAMGLSDNVQVVYDQTGEHGSRIKSVTIDGEQVDPSKDYTIALSTFLIGGGDGYFAEGAIKDVVDLGYMDTQAMIDYIKAGKPAAREGQGQIGAHITGEVKPGNEITVELSSLNYTSEGEPMAKTATVKLGDETATADIDNAKQDGDDQFGERGRATLKLNVPADFTCDTPLEITTDAGTEATLPLDDATCSDEPGKGDTTDSSSLSSLSSLDSGSSKGLGIAAGVIAAIVGIIGVVGMNMHMLPAPVRAFIENLRKQFNI
ncbi:bifunctional metallophosphatase/5'-nucleotidase [Corynebacterium sp. HMSC06G04]|uniref:bifunctional metallophosphatase/5'-nucleotidase n=1 Tax=Corynebacterium sp. HMSC06G04 TaxID=1581126 RepID=UPI0008A617DB|nr:bifunctional UDP-sugar hydrolase/5'-nucleotidase [Corynebacterium sp. HMSC06G04]OFT44429.1 bifunctional metallophosphatase/5'-nucleotidase [Corynebacterium sp. HMSC06G04]